MHMGTSAQNLPAIGGFYDGDEDCSTRLLKGGRAKWADKVWTMGGSPLREDDRWLVTGAGFALQRFENGQPEVILKEPGKPLPDPDLLNEQLCQGQWPINKFTNLPEPPW